MTDRAPEAPNMLGRERSPKAKAAIGEVTVAPLGRDFDLGSILPKSQADPTSSLVRRFSQRQRQDRMTR